MSLAVAVWHGSGNTNLTPQSGGQVDRGAGRHQGDAGVVCAVVSGLYYRVLLCYKLKYLWNL